MAWVDTRTEKNEVATINSVVVTHTEAPEHVEIEERLYVLVVRHVIGFHGRGFMGHYRDIEDWHSGNTRVFYGVDEAARQQAIEAGREAILKRDLFLTKAA